MSQTIRLVVNSERYEVAVEPSDTLLDVLRDRLNLTGTKRGCDSGECGACTVLLNDAPVSSCLVLAVEVDNQEILTIEGLAEGVDCLHPLQKAFIKYGALQCGFCTPGMILTAKALLDVNKHPTEEEVRTAIAGNLCRCTGYVKIVEAILAASEEMRRVSE